MKRYIARSKNLTAFVTNDRVTLPLGYDSVSVRIIGANPKLNLPPRARLRQLLSRFAHQLDSQKRRPRPSRIRQDNVSRIRQIANGNIATFAGGLTIGPSGDNGPATSATPRQF
jgi:hypothetical protein